MHMYVLCSCMCLLLLINYKEQLLRESEFQLCLFDVT